MPDVFDCDGCSTRQCESPNNEPWAFIVWRDINGDPVEPGGGRVCPKPRVMRSPGANFLWRGYTNLRDHHIPMFAGGSAAMPAFWDEALLFLDSICKRHRAEEMRQETKRAQARARSGR